MTSRTFTVFQDVHTDEVVKAKAKPVTSNIMTTRSASRSNNIPPSSSASNEPPPVDKENVNPLTGERAGTVATSKKRKTNVLSAKCSAPLATKKAKSSKDSQSHSKKRKASSEAEEIKVVTKKEAKAAGSTRKTTKRVTRKVSKLPRLEEESINKAQETECAQASIDSRCYDLTVKPLADVSQAYETAELAVDPLPSPASKAKFRKDASAEPEIRDFFPSSQTLASLPSTSTARASPSELNGNKKFSTPELKQIYTAFTFSSPSPTSERLKSLSRSGSVPRLELA